MRKRLAKATLSFLPITCLLAATATTALADAPPRASAAASAAASPAASPAASGMAAAAGSAKAEDDDPGVNADETAEDKDLRRNYIRRTKRHLEDALHATSRDLSDDERAAIKKHWRLSMRLWRIRHLAHAAADKATMAKVDAMLAKADEKTDAKLKELASKTMPAGSAAPSMSAGKK